MGLDLQKTELQVQRIIREIYSIFSKKIDFLFFNFKVFYIYTMWGIIVRGHRQRSGVFVGVIGLSELVPFRVIFHQRKLRSNRYCLQDHQIVYSQIDAIILNLLFWVKIIYCQTHLKKIWVILEIYDIKSDPRSCIILYESPRVGCTKPE